MLQRLRCFIEELLLVQFPHQRLFIFIDEIDSLLGLNFSVDDFFALIRFCYNQRAINPEYQRITFAIFGVATPSDLIQDRTKTPFNIGRAIELKGFEWDEVSPLIQGLDNSVEQPEAVLMAILDWTAGQPFLTQKLCHLIMQLGQQTMKDGEPIIIPLGTESVWIEKLVRTRIIDRWESQDEPEHLRTIRDRIERNGQRAGRMLGIYQQILEGVDVKADDSHEHVELLLSGLVVRQHSWLKVKNRIYAEVFNLGWVEKQLGALRPYSQALNAWVASGHRVAISPNGQLLAVTTLDGHIHLWRVTGTQQVLPLKDWAAHSRPVWDIAFSPNGQLIASVGGDNTIKLWQADGTLKRTLKGHQASVWSVAFSPDGRSLVSGSLDKTVKRWSISGTLLNTFTGHAGATWDVAVSPDGKTIASASADNTIKLWQPDGTLLRTILGHTSEVLGVAFSPDQPTLVSSSLDRSVNLWRLDGTLIHSFQGHQGGILDLAFSPDGQVIASASEDGTAKLWKSTSVLSKTLYGHSVVVWDVAFSPDSQRLASAGEAIRLWQHNGTPLKQFQATDTGVVNTVAFSPNGQQMVTGGDDRKVRLWKQDGTLIRTLGQHEDIIFRVAFSPDSQRVASVGDDQVVRLWGIDGTPISMFKGHKGRIWDVAFSANGQFIASASEDGTVKLWSVVPLQGSKLQRSVSRGGGHPVKHLVGT